MAVTKCDDIGMKRLFEMWLQIAAVLELDEAIQTVVAPLENIGELKPEPEECVKLFNKGKDIVALLPTGLGKA